MPQLPSAIDLQYYLHLKTPHIPAQKLQLRAHGNEIERLHELRVSARLVRGACRLFGVAFQAYRHRRSAAADVTHTTRPNHVRRCFCCCCQHCLNGRKTITNHHKIVPCTINTDTQHNSAAFRSFSELLTAMFYDCF